MTKLHKKEQALIMRKRGQSIAAISETLSVSKSTVSVWCRNIALSESAMNKIAATGNIKATVALMKYSELKRKLRQEAEYESFNAGKTRLGNLSKRDIYCIGLGLYWGEGYKSGSQEFGFTNCDPQMILFYILWLRTVFNIKKSSLILRVSINQSHKFRVTAVEEYWSKLLNIPLFQFSKTSLIKSQSKKIYSNNNSHMGTLRIKVRKGTAQRREVLGAIKSIN